MLRFLPSVVCCTAEVRQMKRHAGAGAGTVAVLALGRQRAEVLRPDAQRLLAVGQVRRRQRRRRRLHKRIPIADPRGSSESSSCHAAAAWLLQSVVQVRMLPDGCTTDVPQPIRCYASAIHPALAKPWDLRQLVGRVRQLLAAVLMGAEPVSARRAAAAFGCCSACKPACAVLVMAAAGDSSTPADFACVQLPAHSSPQHACVAACVYTSQVASHQGDPLQLSYFWAQNLPLQPATRQMLLSAPCAAERLRLLAQLLARIDSLCCGACGRRLAAAADVFAMTAEGVGSTFVNSAGCAAAGCERVLCVPVCCDRRQLRRC